MSTVQVEFFVMVGSKLVHESEGPTLDSCPTGIDGAILFKVGDQIVLDERYWDRLDVSLLELMKALDTASSGTSSLAVLPDTKLEVQFRAEPVNEVELEYRTYACDVGEAQKAFRACGYRFLAWLDGNQLQSTAGTQLQHALRAAGA